MTKRENETVNIMAAFACGGILGAGIALLLAPRSGKETRRAISHMSEQAGKRSRRLAADLVTDMDRIFDDIRDDLKSRMNDGKIWTEEKMSGIEQALLAGKKQIQKEMDHILHS
jgi:gas vesicle protein